MAVEHRPVELVGVKSVMSDDCTYRCWVYLHDRELQRDNETLQAANLLIRQELNRRTWKPVPQPESQSRWQTVPAPVIKERAPLIHERVLSLINGKPIKARILGRRIGCCPDSITVALRKLRNEGRIIRQPDGWILTTKAKG